MAAEYIPVGLRIDVDTMRGTITGVPNLVAILAEHGVTATFFFSVGPDNMGRHLWRLFRPTFLMKMLRSRAVSLYGWDILLRGTFWPGSIIGERATRQIQMAADGHEVGLHAWDHHREQSRIEKMSSEEVHRNLDRGKRLLETIIGRKIYCMAAPSWKATTLLLQARKTFDLRYNSDCRGHTIFRPIAGSELLEQPQIPTTLPTYDEVVGKDGVTPENYNKYILSQVRPGVLNVLTIHAEVEGAACQSMFRDFLAEAQRKKIRFQPLGSLLQKGNHDFETAEIIRNSVPGREGWVACQRTESKDR
ncbi:MAG: 4-deoxy-4-formamido-L-arabinose-phosphoundecaprenol deformylase [Desulforhopalus sp.]